jgi:hypothetical protein
MCSESFLESTPVRSDGLPFNVTDSEAHVVLAVADDVGGRKQDVLGQHNGISLVWIAPA